MPIVNTASVLYDRDLFKQFQYRLKRERNRERDNWRVYDATDWGQWDDEALRFLIQEGRPPSSFNFTKRFVDTTAGSIMADPFDVGFETELGEKNDFAILMQELWKEDRELGNWQHDFHMFTRGGFVYRGWLEMFIDRSRDPRGRIGLRYVNPDRVLVDPDWTTHKVRDNKSIFVWSWLTAQQIKNKYKKNSEEIEQAIQLAKRAYGASGTDIEGEKIYDLSPEFYDKLNDQFLVFDKYELIAKEKKRYFDPIEAIWVPNMEGEQLEMFLATAKILGRPLEEVSETVYECWVRTLCPGLGVNLEIQNGKHPLQTGNYPLFPFSSDMINGRPNTYVDQLKDPQQTYNKRESTATHVMMTGANNALLIETDAVVHAEDVDTIGKGRNRPGFYSEVAEGGIQKIGYLQKPPAPTEFWSAGDRAYAMAEKITPSVPSVQGIGEPGESGVLFQAKVAQAQIGLQIPMKFLKSVYQDIGDAYFAAAQQVYTYPMVFTSKKAGGVYHLNMPDGIYMKDLNRMRVTITQSPTSDTFRRGLLQLYTSLFQSIPPGPTRQALSRLVIRHLPGVPDEELEQLSQIAGLEEELAKLGVMGQIAQLRGSMQQMALPAPGAPPAGPQMPSQGTALPPGHGASQGPQQPPVEMPSI